MLRQLNQLQASAAEQSKIAFKLSKHVSHPLLYLA
jgi:hypothetical protein